MYEELRANLSQAGPQRLARAQVKWAKLALNNRQEPRRGNSSRGRARVPSLLELPQLRKLVHRHGRQFAVVAGQDHQVAVDLVVRVAAEVKAMAAALLTD